MNFDKYQTAIIEHNHKDSEVLLIPACAGSGKSTSILAKIARIIREAENPEEQASKILATTFSNKSARDLINKFKDSYPDLPMPKISTLHSFGLQVIKEDGLKFSVLTEWNSTLLIRGIIEQMNLFEEGTRKSVLTNVSEIIKDIIANLKANSKFSISQLKKQNFEVEPYLEQVDDVDTYNIILENFIDIAIQYEARKTKDNLMDYNDLIYKANQLLDFNETLHNEIRDKLDYIFIDEAQDCDKSQFELFLKLSYGKKLTLVFDKCQTLYKFRWSKPELLEPHHLKTSFEHITELPLLYNYRSTQNIVKVGNILREAANDEFRSESSRESIKGSVKLKVCATNLQEGDVITKQIEEYIRDGYQLSDITVISRGNWYLKTIVEPAMIRKNIPYTYAAKSSGKRLNEKNINRLYFSLIAFILNNKDYTAVLGCAQYIRGVGEAFIKKLENIYISQGITNLTLSGNFTTKSDLDKCKDVDMLILELIDISKDLNSYTASSLLEVLKELIFKYMILPCDYEEMQQIETAVANWINFYIENGKINTSDILETIMLEINNFDITDNKNVVKLSTIHQTKGLSLPATICGGFCSGTPFKDDYQDEAYMIYVQMSRAIDKLSIIYSTEYITKSNKVMEPHINPYLLYLLDVIKS